MEYLQSRGLPCVRQVMGGSNDKGDVYGIPDWTIECKNEKSIQLAAYVDDATKEARNGKTPWWCAVVKRRNKGIKNAYVIFDLEQLADLLWMLHNRVPAE